MCDVYTDEIFQGLFRRLFKACTHLRNRVDHAWNVIVIFFTEKKSLKFDENFFQTVTS